MEATGETKSITDALIADTLPIGIRSSCGPICNFQGKLSEEESAYIRNAIPARLQEFVAGRTCAKQALAKLGIYACSIPVGRCREPIWPSHVIGSITHEYPFVIAAVAERRFISHLGIDLATTQPLDRSIIRLLCTDEELLHISKFEWSEHCIDPYKIIFSVKEAIYKSLFPFIGEVFEFKDVSISVIPDEYAASLRINTDRLPYALESKVKCVYSRIGDFIFSAAWIAAV